MTLLTDSETASRYFLNLGGGIEMDAGTAFLIRRNAGVLAEDNTPNATNYQNRVNSRSHDLPAQNPYPKSPVIAAIVAGFALATLTIIAVLIFNSVTK